MILSRTSQYAIQSMIYLAGQESGKPFLVREVAAHLKLPPHYLAKILQILAKGHLLDSFRGRLGGFLLRPEGMNVTLMDILTLTEGPTYTKRCLLGLKECSNETACPLHFHWSPIKERLIELLHETSLAHLAQAVQSGRYRLADLPAALFHEPEPP